MLYGNFWCHSNLLQNLKQSNAYAHLLRMWTSPRHGGDFHRRGDGVEHQRVQNETDASISPLDDPSQGSGVSMERKRHVQCVDVIEGGPSHGSNGRWRHSGEERVAVFLKGGGEGPRGSSGVHHKTAQLGDARCFHGAVLPCHDKKPEAGGTDFTWVRQTLMNYRNDAKI